jgi:hypothetical protein
MEFRRSIDSAGHWLELKKTFASMPLLSRGPAMNILMGEIAKVRK